MDERRRCGRRNSEIRSKKLNGRAYVLLACESAVWVRRPRVRLRSWRLEAGPQRTAWRRRGFKEGAAGVNTTLAVWMFYLLDLPAKLAGRLNLSWINFHVSDCFSVCAGQRTLISVHELSVTLLTTLMRRLISFLCRCLGSTLVLHIISSALSIVIVRQASPVLAQGHTNIGHVYREVPVVVSVTASVVRV